MRLHIESIGIAAGRQVSPWKPVPMYSGNVARRYSQYTAQTTYSHAKFIVSKHQVRNLVASSPCPLTRLKNYHHKITLLFSYSMWKWMMLYQRFLCYTESIFFFMWQIHSKQNLSCLLVCSSFCFCMRRFSTELNQLERIQNTCSFFIIKMIALDIFKL